jgi:hypothetical protein
MVTDGLFQKKVSNGKRFGSTHQALPVCRSELFESPNNVKCRQLQASGYLSVAQTLTCSNRRLL